MKELSHDNKECATLIPCYSLHYKNYKRQHILTNSSFVSEMLCKLHHPFTAVVAGPTGCGKSAWVLRLVENAMEMILRLYAITMVNINQFSTITRN